jgi:hypothetical protein
VFDEYILRFDIAMDDSRFATSPMDFKV